MLPTLLLLPILSLPMREMPKRQSPEDRAVAYLVREVPRWPVINRCYSCHNNGDGARVLYLARQRGIDVPDKALKDTTAWLEKPSDWVRPKQEEGVYDKKLATLQFASTLLAAREAGRVEGMTAARQAAERVAGLQNRDGFWSVGTQDAIGSPTTRGTPLATVLARRILLRIDARQYKTAIARADAWLRQIKVENLMDASAVLLGLEQADDAGAKEQRRVALALIRRAERKEGGWGPYRTAAAEPFDTALVVLALRMQPNSDETRDMLQRGRAYLIRKQQEDGSWSETTRPADAISYAQRVSTTAWALEALLATRTR